MAERAEAEGRDFAPRHGLTVTDTITDRYGKQDPHHRDGWLHVRELADSGRIGAVIARWPSTARLRSRAITELATLGVEVFYSWPPLGPTGADRR
ncbi:hypothetical protein [Streptomyces albospinus]|uniref:hypothetical protein n=1 Tax=Streptomyces albospinus TaxID=285515 RepID=UPI00166FEC94|nr:hypothetical protein [Streptomyces albospinus]